MSSDERTGDMLAAQRRLWRFRLDEAECSEMEVDRCIAWCEETILNGILLSWFCRGLVRMRWNAIEDKPEFDAV